MKKILLTGPESSGKTFLATYLAKHFNGIMVPEYARKFITSHPSYDQDDLLYIAKKQVQLIHKNEKTNTKYLFIDTGPEVVQIWSLVKFESIHPHISLLVSQESYNLVLLCEPNIPWIPDPLRENPSDRDRLFQLYKNLTQKYHHNTKIINAPINQRIYQAINFIKQIP